MISGGGDFDELQWVHQAKGLHNNSRYNNNMTRKESDNFEENLDT